MSKLRLLIYALESYGVRFLARVSSLLSFETIDGLARRIGDFVFFAGGSRKKTARDNIERAFGTVLSPQERQALLKASYRHVALALMELYTIPRLRDKAAGRITFSGLEHLDKAFAAGKGVIYVISHIGSWELLAFLPYLQHYPCSVVVKNIKNPFLDERTNDLRRMLALNPIHKKNSSKTILRELKENRLVAVLIDQWAGREGIWCDFFGSPTSTTSIPARLAKKTGAALIPARCVRTGPGYYRIENDPPVPLEEGLDWEYKTTLKLNRLLEESILKYKDQWIWGHKRWKKKPDSIRLASPTAALS